ncbi:MAG: CBS domain-containing protein [Ginsengibacter sp.]
MTTVHLIDNQLPTIQRSASISDALKLAANYNVSHLPVIDDEKFEGLISEEDLLAASDSSKSIAELSSNLLSRSINATDHFLKAAQFCNLYRANIVPVKNDEGEFIGSIPAYNLLNELGNLCGANEMGALIVLETEQSKLSISEINSIVESDGAIILHLNINTQPPSSLVRITLQLNKKEVSTIIASFERYEYSIVYYVGEEIFENDISVNYQNLMNYLDI